MNARVKAIIELERLPDGSVIMSLFRGHAQWAKFKIVAGGNLLFRARRAVYEESAGDADAFFEAHGMADAKAFDAKTWTGRSSHSGRMMNKSKHPNDPRCGCSFTKSDPGRKDHAGLPMHQCSFLQEMDDHDTKCTCCEKKMKVCAEDI